MQRRKWLPKLCTMELIASYCLTEPGAGSDAAALRTRAVRDGDHYIVNGQKTWNTLGHFADWIFCLVRTDLEAKPQSGITFLLIDMKSPGISVRPIALMDGGREVNDVWFENVRVPLENRVGEENRGWTYAKFLLGHERTLIAGIGTAKRELARLKRVAAARREDGTALLDDALFAARVARVEIELAALEITNLRVLCDEQNARAPGPAASMLKIRGSEIHQTLSELLMRAAGAYALPMRREAMEAGWQADPGAAGATAAYLNLRKLSIFGGTNEIQRNIIAKMMGL
jgi:alkylation response protein AidB-like acyl-CoA dehydrogenase